MDEQAADEELMRCYARGDAAAFDVLYRRHEMKVWRFLQRSLANAALAEEVMQEVWFAVAREAERYRPTARFTTWLFTMAHHRLVDAYRRRRPWVSLDSPGMATLVEQLAADPSADPARDVEAAQHGAALVAAVERLPAEQREAFLLQAEGGLTVEEIAVATGSHLETAKSRLRYARSKLRQLLQEFA